MTGTPIAFRRGFICITWERNVVPVSGAAVNSAVRASPSTLVSLSVLGSLSEPGSAVPVTSRGIFWDQMPFVFLTHIIFYTHRNVLFSWWLHWSRSQGTWNCASGRAGLYMVCSWPSFSETTDLHWCKRTWSEAQRQQDCAQMDLYIK